MQTSSIDLIRADGLTARDIVAALAMAAIGLALMPVVGLAVLLLG
jgi:hypothetical protein